MKSVTLLITSGWQLWMFTQPGSTRWAQRDTLRVGSHRLPTSTTPWELGYFCPTVIYCQLTPTSDCSSECWGVGGKAWTPHEQLSYPPLISASHGSQPSYSEPVPLPCWGSAWGCMVTVSPAALSFLLFFHCHSTPLCFQLSVPT